MKYILKVLKHGNIMEGLFYQAFLFALVVMFYDSMTGLAVDTLSIFAGIIMLIVAGDKLVSSASDIGEKLGMNRLLIGIVIIGFGTSAPEVITVFIAGMQDATDLALGNIFGSNIANIGLILGAGLIMLNKTIHTADKWEEYLRLLVATILMVMVVFFYGKVDWIVSTILLAGLAYYIFKTIKENIIADEPEEPLYELAPDAIANPTSSWVSDISGVVIGLAGLMVGANVLVNGSVHIATAMGIPEKVIGLTIIAIGTSLPELASAYSAAKKGYGDMILGNVLGSNVFNLLAASSAGGIVSILPTESVTTDVIVMAIFTVSLLLLMFQKVQAKTFGIMLLVGYLSFLTFTGFSI